MYDHLIIEGKNVRKKQKNFKIKIRTDTIHATDTETNRYRDRPVSVKQPTPIPILPTLGRSSGYVQGPRFLRDFTLFACFLKLIQPCYKVKIRKISSKYLV